jgi:hypothetical protein
MYYHLPVHLPQRHLLPCVHHVGLQLSLYGAMVETIHTPVPVGGAELADTGTVVAGCIAFSVTWILVAFERVPCLPIGRTAGALLGAALMVATGVLTNHEVHVFQQHVKCCQMPFKGC